MSEALAVREEALVLSEPEIVLEEAHRAAAALKRVIDSKANKVMMGGQQYLEFEDWQTLGRFYGLTAKEDGDAEWIERPDGVEGFKASAVVLDRGGMVRSRATAYCLDDEPNWTRKPKFQLSSMAQTRACAKALRNVLSWVVVLAGYRPTPAEELQVMADKQRKSESAAAPASKPKRPPPKPLIETEPEEDEIVIGLPDEMLITDVQRRRMFAIWKAAGWKDSEAREFLEAKYGITSTTQVPRSLYDQLCKEYEAGAPK